MAPAQPGTLIIIRGLLAFLAMAAISGSGMIAWSRSTPGGRRSKVWTDAQPSGAWGYLSRRRA